VTVIAYVPLAAPAGTLTVAVDPAAAVEADKFTDVGDMVQLVPAGPIGSCCPRMVGIP
jgi:hypothetical protein